MRNKTIFMSTLSNREMKRDIVISIIAIGIAYRVSLAFCILIALYRFKILYFRYQAINHLLVTTYQSYIWELVWLGISIVVCAWVPVYFAACILSYRGYMLYRVIRVRAKWGDI